MILACPLLQYSYPILSFLPSDSPKAFDPDFYLPLVLSFRSSAAKPDFSHKIKDRLSLSIEFRAYFVTSSLLYFDRNENTIKSFSSIYPFISQITLSSGFSDSNIRSKFSLSSNAESDKRMVLAPVSASSGTM